jgi:RNase H-fold protein (predicted Holliday junction resolvase)
MLLVAVSFKVHRSNPKHSQKLTHILLRLPQPQVFILLDLGKQRFGKAFSHIFKFLASMTSANRNHSPELAEKILKLCDQLLDKVDESWDTERKAEDQRVTVYQAYKKLLQKDLN